MACRVLDTLHLHARGTVEGAHASEHQCGRGNETILDAKGPGGHPIWRKVGPNVRRRMLALIRWLGLQDSWRQRRQLHRQGRLLRISYLCKRRSEHLRLVDPSQGARRWPQASHPALATQSLWILVEDGRKKGWSNYLLEQMVDRLQR